MKDTPKFSEYRKLDDAFRLFYKAKLFPGSYLLPCKMTF